MKINTGAYKAVKGKLPTGNGYWAFRISGSTVGIYGSYEKASKRATELAELVKVRSITLLPDSKDGSKMEKPKDPLHIMITIRIQADKTCEIEVRQTKGTVTELQNYSQDRTAPNLVIARDWAWQYSEALRSIIKHAVVGVMELPEGMQFKNHLAEYIHE
jgi:hypothetical protein